MSSVELEQAPTIRDAKWDSVLRLMDYLNRKWAHSTAHGEAEVQLKFPTQLVLLLHDALQHMIDHQMPLYRLHVGAEEYSRAMLVSASTAEESMQNTCMRANELIVDLEILLEHFIGRPHITMQQIRKLREKRQRK